MKSLRYTSAVMALAFLTSCSAIQSDEDIHIDYQYQDSREAEQRSVDLQGMSLTVTAVGLHNASYLGVKSSGKGYFFVVDYVLINNSMSTRAFDPDHLILVTESGDQYEVSDYSHKKFSDFTQPITEILEGETVSSKVIYEMPVSTTPDNILIKGLTKGRDQVIDLQIPDKNKDRY